VPLPLDKYTTTASRTATASADFATSDLDGGMPNTQKVTYFRVQTIVGTAASMSIAFYYGASGTNSTVADFNGGSALTANNLYLFYHEGRPSQFFNYRFGSSVTIKQLYVSEHFSDIV